MASAVPLMMGVLVFVAVECGLAAGATGVPISPSQRTDFAGMVLAASRAVGEALPTRLRESRRLLAAVEGLRNLPRAPSWRLDAFRRSDLLGLWALLSLGAAAFLALVSLSVIGACVGAVAPTAGLLAWEARDRRAREKRVESAMPEAFNALSMALGSGHSLSQGMRFVGSHAEEPIKGEFLQVSYSVSCGIPVGEALGDMLTRLRAPGLDLVALALNVSRRTGAPLAGLLAEASSMVGERIELARMLDVKTSQARMSARLVAGMPCAMVAILSLLSEDFRQGLTTATGIASVAAAMVLDVIAWSVIKKIMKVEL